MKKMSGAGRKVLKIIHLYLAALWLGGAVTLNLMIFALGPATSGEQLFGYDLARKFVDYFIIIPGALGCLVSGLLISGLTPWGFFKHRWVTLKLILTVLCILFGTFILGPFLDTQPLISEKIGLDALINPNYLANIKGNLLGGLVQLAAMFFMTAISVIKPWPKKLKSPNQQLSP
ncbi:MAG: DUF2269 family protein [Candidatus Adiutrix intracellularis]|jgi:hypothetical protein|nr:DUF2269 family protein [Candidatus Adiutrix intracellularis]